MRLEHHNGHHLRRTATILLTFVLLAGCASQSFNVEDQSLKDLDTKRPNENLLDSNPQSLGDDPHEEENRFESSVDGGRTLDPVEIHAVDVTPAAHEIREIGNDPLGEHSLPGNPALDGIDQPEACAYIALRNINCRMSDAPESSLIAILMQGEQANLLYLNPAFTHGKFDLLNGYRCWIQMSFMDGPSDPLKACQVYIVDAPSMPDLSDLEGSSHPACSSDLDPAACAAAGGTWQSGGAAAGSDYCKCSG